MQIEQQPGGFSSSFENRNDCSISAKFVIFNFYYTEVEDIYSKYMLSRRRREDPALVAVPVPHKPGCYIFQKRKRRPNAVSNYASTFETSVNYESDMKA